MLVGEERGILSMACYAAVASLLNLLDDIVHYDRYQHLGIEKLASILVPFLVRFKHVKVLLQKHSSIGNKGVDDVQSKIRDVAYEAHDMIQYEIHHWMTIDTHLMPITVSEDFVKDLSMLEQRIVSLMEDMMVVEEGQTNEEPKHMEHHSFNASASDPSQAYENTMIGFDVYLNTIKDELCGQSSKLQVIPIVGMGGIGKTTLARNAFNDPLILHHFDIHGWVTISQDYSLNRVLQNLMKSLRMKEVPEKDDAALKVIIYQYLIGRRYLIVIDDIWREEVWDNLKCLFPNDHCGSRILLTSRLEDVASYSGTLAYHHKIGFLNENESWNLLQEKVFAQEHCPAKLEDIGKHIAKRCRGLPLAIIVIAGVLTKIRTQKHWKDIEENLTANLSGDDNELSNIILSLSYNHLPHRLRACFLYIGRFPEDYEIEITRLINLWIAEGFIESRSGSKILEEVAEECLQDLVKRSLVLITKRKSSGKFKFCVMHDVLRDFCKMQGLHEKFFHVKIDMEDVNLSSRTVRRINLHMHPLRLSPINASTVNKSLRSTICVGIGNASLSSDHILFHGFMLLEILDLLDIKCKGFPKVVFQLIHLKYLAMRARETGGLFSSTTIMIPRSISKLQNLQTLIMVWTMKLFVKNIICPDEIWEMPRLRHLIIRGIALPSPPLIAANGGLENLQTLSVGRHFVFTSEAVRMIPNLTKLKILCFGIQRKDEWDSYSNLAHLCKLEKLSIILGNTIHVRSCLLISPSL